MPAKVEVRKLVSTEPAHITTAVIAETPHLSRSIIRAACSQLKGKHFMEGATA